MSEDAKPDCWQDDRVGVVGCERCPELVDSRSQIVNGVGPADADLLFVGEAPGANEDEQGEPFVGRSGKVLDEGLRDIGLARQDIRITNCVRCRPPDNRDPTTEEQGNCRGYLDREIAAVEPDLIVTLGKVPGELVLGRSVAVTNEAGDIDEIEVDGERWQVLISVHPAATLYDPSQQSAFDDALTVAAEHAGDGGQSSLGDF